MLYNKLKNTECKTERYKMESDNNFKLDFDDSDLRLDDDISPVSIKPRKKRPAAAKRNTGVKNSDMTDPYDLSEDTGSESSSEQTAEKPMSADEMAKMIARNMALNTEEYSAPDYGAYTAPAAVKTRERTAADEEHKKSTNNKKKKKRRKKSSAGKKAAIILTVFVVMFAAGGGAFYLMGMNAYKGVFLDKTYINGINVSGKTQAEALALVQAQSEYPEAVVITRRDGSQINIKLEDIGYKDNTKAFVTEYYKEQDHYKWFSAKFNETNYEIKNSFKYDKSQLEAILKRKVVEAEMTVQPQDAYIKANEDGRTFYVVPEVDGDKVDTDKIDLLYNYVEEALDEKIFTMDISHVDCYQKAKVSAEDIQEDCDKLNNLSSLELTFDFTYTTETLTGDTIMDWIEFDSDKPSEGFSVDEDKAMKYVEELAEKYDTFNKDREFKTTNRGVMTIPQGQGCYGWWIDQEETKNLICDLIKEDDSVETEPVYYVNPYSSYTYTCDPEWRTADKDFSDTYFEVDLSAQHLWYYENGELKMESDIVSGYTSESRKTPAGVYKLWLKERGKTLTGSSDGRSYSSYVEYWNNISTISIGFHDASWQNGVFGGEKYKSATWGSHGCINMPADKAKYIYDNCEYGTPVFMYY